MSVSLGVHNIETLVYPTRAGLPEENGVVRIHFPPVVALILLGSLAACTSAPPKPESQTAPGVDLAAYGTFGWASPTGETPSDAPLRMLDVNIRTAIRGELTKRGYTEAASDPQMLVTYDTEAKDKIKSSPFRIGIGIGSFGSSGGGSVNVGSSSVQSYQEGRLTIHIVDAAGNKEVWLGTLSGKVDTTNLDAAAVARVVALTMQNFPARR
jgi:hypothetical protein